MRPILQILLFTLCWRGSVAADWPQFRGPEGQGHAEARDLPTQWSETKNVTWKVAVPGKGLSSPVIRGDQIWVTTALDDGRSLRALCFHRRDGRKVHDRELFRPAEPSAVHSKNSRATPTPVIDDAHVYVHFGVSGTACLSMGGDVIWKNSELEYHQPYAGVSCPILFGDLLILSCDGTDVQFVTALDKRTGKRVWKTPRGHLEAALQRVETESYPERGFPLMAYSTPLVVDVNGVPQLVSPAADHVAAYDARTGKEIWWLSYSGFSEVARPVYAHGLMFVAGFETQAQPTLYAIRPEGQGAVGETHLEWKVTRGVPHVPSPIVVGEELYMVNDDGIGTCIDAKTGASRWTKRIGGNYSASPIYADGKIYFLSEAGKTTIIAPEKKYRIVGVNELDGRFLASPAAVGRAIFLRSDGHLYRIEQDRRP